MRIAHLSDSHISLGGPTDTERLAALQACVDAINALDPQPDLVVHTGDIVHNGTDREYEASAVILRAVAAPLRVIPGNKDVRDGMRRAFPESCGPDELGGLIQFFETYGNIRCIFLDTRSEASNKGIMCSERLEHFRSASGHDGAATFVFMHHPPFDVWTAPEPFQFEERADAEEIFAILERCTGKTVVVTGHIHRPWEEKRGKNELRAVTALARDLRKGEDLSEMADDGFFVTYEIAEDGAFSSKLHRVLCPG